MRGRKISYRGIKEMYLLFEKIELQVNFNQFEGVCVNFEGGQCWT